MAYFTGKRAVVTGAGSGMGRALAEQLNSTGCSVWLSDINAEHLAETAARLDDSKADVHTSTVDVADQDAVNAWAAEVSAEAPSIELLVNNAGVALSGLAREVPTPDFHWLMNINFWGVVHGSGAFLPLLEKAERSHLLNISSVFGMIAVPTQSAYNAAKFAVRGYSEALRQELDLAGSPVKVCCVHPGGIDTNIARSARNFDPTATPESQQEMFQKHVRTSATEAARQMLIAAEKGQRRLLIGSDARLIGWITRLFPTSYPGIIQRLMGDSLSDLLTR
ncbi:MAG: SDR family NAD(P)-dependent oxidoreductase [Pseudomonadota bacterium]